MVVTCRNREPRDAYDQVSGLRLKGHSLESSLHEVVHVAQAAMPGASEVSATLLVANVVTARAYTAELALDLDEVQYAVQSGPAVDAIATGRLVHVDDMASETRWVDFVEAAKACGVCSVISVPISAEAESRVSAGLSVYSTRPHAFGANTLAIALGFARYAESTVLNAHVHETCRELTRHLAAALAARPTIDQAKGIVMRDRACTAEEALEMLVAASQRSNRKLRDVASDIVESVTNST
jgi:GAF domain-containing protein